MQGVSGEGANDMQGVPNDMQGVPAPADIEPTGGNVASVEELLTIALVAKRLDIKPTTVRKYRSLGILPEPDAMIGHVPLWKPITIDRWLPTRPGKGVGGGAPMHRRRRERGAA